MMIHVAVDEYSPGTPRQSSERRMIRPLAADARAVNRLINVSSFAMSSPQGAGVPAIMSSGAVGAFFGNGATLMISCFSGG